MSGRGNRVGVTNLLLSLVVNSLVKRDLGCCEEWEGESRSCMWAPEELVSDLRNRQQSRIEEEL